MYAGALNADQVLDSLKKEIIYDQTTLEQKWSSIQDQLRTQSLSEEDVLLTLQSGFLQTPTGKALAPLFAEAFLRSIRPTDGLEPERLRAFVDIICHLPPDRWADGFGENVNFPRGLNGKGVHGFIQTQLNSAQALRYEKIAAGELLSDDTWKTLRDFTRQARQYIRVPSKEPVNDYLSQLEDLFYIRPSPKEAQTLMTGFIEAMGEPSSSRRVRWPARFPADAQKLCDSITAEVVDNRPDRTWLEEVVDTQSLKATLSKVTTPVKAGLNVLRSISLNDIGNELGNALDHAVGYVAFNFVYRPELEPIVIAKSPDTTSYSELLEVMQEIEDTSSFYTEVDTKGPRYTGGIAGKLLYVLNALDTFGVLQIAEKVRPHLPAVPMPPLVVPAPGKAEGPDIEPPSIPGADLKAKAASPQTQVDGFISSLDLQSDTGSTKTIVAGAEHADSPASPYAAPDATTLEQLTASVLGVLHRIDEALTFPSASAEDEMVSELQGFLENLQKMEEGRSEDPMIYRATVEGVSIPSWWETIAPEFHSVLTRITDIATASGGYLLGKTAAGANVAWNNRGNVAIATLGFVGLWATYEKIAEQFSHPPPAASDQNETHEFIESPSLQQERMDDELVEILKEPVASNKPTPWDQIAEFVQQSSKQDPLNDPQVFEQIEQLLKKNSLITKIQKLSLHPHSTATIIQATDAEPTALRRVARHAEFDADFQADAPAGSEDADYQADAPAGSEDAEETEADNGAILTDYLNTMEALQRSNSDVYEEIDTDIPTDPVEDATREVVRVLRRRRNVTYMDASRAAGDRELIPRYTKALLDIANSPPLRATLKIQVPMHSEFGQCWLNFVKASYNPFFTDWCRKQKLDLSTVTIEAVKNSLSGIADGVRKTFTLGDDSGWANVAGPILRTAKVIDPTYEGVPYPSPSYQAPFGLVGAFHGERLYLSKAEAQKRAKDLNDRQAFSEISADDPFRPLEPRSDAAIERERQHVGDLHNYHALVTTLNILVQGKADDAAMSLDNDLIGAHGDSSFAVAYPVESRKAVSVQRFILASGWKVPTNAGEARNLVQVLSSPLPDSSERGNYWGALAYPRPLTAAQQSTIRDTVRQVAGSSGLLDYLLHGKTVTSPKQGLNLALNSARAETLGKTLESKLDAISTSTSAAEWVMAALVLDLDSTLGQKRNHVAGYNLTQEANWGVKPSVVVANLEAHLGVGGKVHATTAPVAAYLLLSGIAPEFLVQGMPDNLVCGTHTWATFRIAVARIEQLNPGATKNMTFQQVMSYGNTGPISLGQEVAVQMVSVNPLIDWAIANGVIVQSADNNYTQATLDIAQEKFNNVTKELAHAGNYLTAPVPTREGLALAELTRVFGEGLPYQDRCLRRKNIPAEVAAPVYSLLDLYITGQLQPGTWGSFNKKIPISKFQSKFGQLKSVKELFENTFNTYFDNLGAGSRSVFKHLVSQLPLDDRRNLEFGTQKFYSLRSQTNVALPDQTAELKDSHIGRHGILIRSEFQNNVTHYEIFPSSLEIRKRTDLPVTLKLDGTFIITGKKDATGRVEEQRGTDQPFDWDAYQSGSPPRKNVTSNVIIEEITPKTQEVVFNRPDYKYDNIPNAFSSNTRLAFLASVVVDEHFIVGKETLHSFARGSTASEDEEVLEGKIADFFLSLIPFKSCIENIVTGNTREAVLDCTLDAAGFVIPGIGAAGKMGRVARSGARFIPKALKMTWIAGSTVVINANPLDGVGDLFRFGKNVICKAGATAYNAASKGIDQIRNLYGTTKAIDSAQLLKRSDITQGVCQSVQAAGQTSRVTAVFKDGKWYDFDVAGNRPYGAPLKNFIPDSAVPLERTTFSDGTSALTPSRLFDTDARTIQRSTYVDVVVGETVYRFDPKQPDVLKEITSPSFQELNDFEAVCSTGKKVKRSLHACFSKLVFERLTLEQTQAQALQHKRIYPSSAEPRTVINERRVFTLTNNGQSLERVKSIQPLNFRSSTTGKIIKDSHFGLPKKQVDSELDSNTRVIKVDGIAHGIEDQRDVRGILVDYDFQQTGSKKYLVTEVDAGLYYYCEYDPAITNLKLTKIEPRYKDSLGSLLINEHDKIRNKYLAAAGTPINRDFIALPPLETLYMDLILKKTTLKKKLRS